MKNFCKKITVASNILIILCLLFVLGCGSKDNSAAKRKDTGNIQSDSLVIELAGVTGKSVFEITKEKHTIVYVESSMGIFVKAIESTPSRKNFGWLFSVNDSFVPVASNDYITNDTDVIKWHYRKF